MNSAIRRIRSAWCRPLLVAVILAVVFFGALALATPHARAYVLAAGVMGMATAGAAVNGWTYWHTGKVALAAGGNTSQFNVNINDANFNGLLLMANSTGPFSTMMIVGGRAFSSGPVHSANMWGTAQQPMKLSLPMTFPVGTVIQVTMTDLSGAANNIDWAIHGYQY